MKAMILAAGRGERMRPLTDSCPKPLLEVGGTPLIVWHLRRLAAAGVTDVVINHAWLGAMIEERLGDGRSYGVNIRYSAEETALETAGGIAKALPLLGDEPFAVINGDIFTDYDFAALTVAAQNLGENLGHLVMVRKADYPTGRDLAIDANGKARLCEEGDQAMTFAGVAVYRPAFFADIAAGQAAALLPSFMRCMERSLLRAELFSGLWLDVGTVERLNQADGWAVGQR
ncbi:N-acetylmuramate alpha-1-phosphate uridylyltransferase MurU [Iodobacter ciconiae]|uniref:Nucleotidyltransferase family protein n=1 Tax=Iodobacter ciconiae TaxID=2496266 RepID=A0A3S8ZVL1_9NEIS|nr:nucleotidyltransferase family protein [Iodobacter ciconiae]AZN37543.1 nucleotidyltransferase family protein [Iodobacter ciconiae]